VAERPQSIKSQRCGAIAWHELLLAMNSKADRVVVSKDYLQEVADCHHRQSKDIYSFGDAEASRKYVMVDRRVLFQFVQDHGKVCQKGKS